MLPAKVRTKNQDRHAGNMTIDFLKNITHTAFAGLVWVLLCTGCSGERPTKNTTSPNLSKIEAERIAFYRDSVFTAAAALVQSGDLVTRMGTDVTSLMLSQLNPTIKDFSHCGIVRIENDTPFVYHCIGGEFNPDQKMRRDPLWLFGHPADNKRLGLYRPAMHTQQLGRVLDSVTAWYRAGLPFDMNFDLATKEAQYCTEMAANAYEAGGNNEVQIKRHIVSGKRYIPVDALLLNPIFSEVGHWYY